MNGPEAPAAVLMAIHPHFVEEILAGVKTVELRRRPPKVEAGTPALMYATHPRCRVEGWFEIGGVASRPPELLWRQVRTSARVSRAHYDAYFAGVVVAHAIEVRRPRRLIRPFRLPTDLRAPQSYRFLYASAKIHRRLLRQAERQLSA